MKKLDSGGMTLVELSVALVLITAISAVIVGFAVDKIQQSTKQTIRYDLLSNAESGLNTVANDIRLSSRADDANRWQDDNAPSAPSNKLSWVSNSTTLVLAIGAQDSDNNIIFDDAHDYVSAKNNYIYYVKNKTLYRRILAAPVSGNKAHTSCPPASATTSCPADKEVMDNVSSFNIKYYDGSSQIVTPSNARSVELSITLLVHRYTQDISASYTTRMVFRNG
jgi:type II secretory pathway pseudopilin PulG